MKFLIKKKLGMKSIIHNQVDRNQLANYLNHRIILQE